MEGRADGRRFALPATWSLWLKEPRDPPEEKDQESPLRSWDTGSVRTTFPALLTLNSEIPFDFTNALS